MRYSGGYNIPGAAGNLAGAPRYIRGKFAPPGVIIKAPHLDSPYIDEQIRRGWTPMTPPAPRGPQLFPLAQGLPMGEQGPSQGPNTPIRYYEGMGYGPYGPSGGGLPPSPMRV